MSADKVAALKQERSELDSRWLRVCQHLQEEKRQQGKAAKRDRICWQLSSRQCKVVLILYGRAGYSAAPAAQYLAMQAKKRNWPPRPGQDLERLVGDLFLQSDVQEFVGLVDEQGPSERYASRWGR